MTLFYVMCVYLSNIVISRSAFELIYPEAIQYPSTSIHARPYISCSYVSI